MNPSHPDRRSFLGFVTNALGALFALVLGVPVVAYVIDPLNRKGSGGDFRVVDGIELGPASNLEAGKPTQGALRNVRRDAYTLYPNDVIGRVWIIPKVNGSALPADFVGTNAEFLDVFTTICPHLGCSVNLNTEGAQVRGFLCPCHAAEFTTTGDRVNPEYNVAARGMDALEWRIEADPDNPEKKLLLVKFQRFESSSALKKIIG